MKIGVSGASGFIGGHLCGALRARGDDVVIASMREPREAARIASHCDAFVNLSGEPIAQRWNARVKDELLRSRTAAPQQFFEALEAFQAKPHIYVSASAIGYYGTSETATFTESDPPGNDFLASVCLQWERIAQQGGRLGMRVACVRAGLVLSNDGGAMSKLLPLFKAGTGGRVGTGRQWYSWIHIRDAVAIYLLALDRIEGAINATAPQPARNEEFVRELARALHRPAALAAPVFMLKAMLGEGAMVVLEGQRVLPARAQTEGYAFAFPDLQHALENLLQ